MATDHRFSITMSDELFQQFEQFRYANHFSTQTKAAVYLLQRSLDDLHAPAPEQPEQVVVSDARSALMEQRFQQLDDEDKLSVYQFAAFLLSQEKYQRDT
jgi:hypothetical protein